MRSKFHDPLRQARDTSMLRRNQSTQPKAALSASLRARQMNPSGGRSAARRSTGKACAKQQKLTLAAVTLSDHTAPLRMSRVESRTFRARHGG
jgi:hypothetical protein